MKLLLVLILTFTVVYATPKAWKNHVKHFKISFESINDVTEK